MTARFLSLRLQDDAKKSHSSINFSLLILVSSFSLTARSYRENNCKSCITMSKSLTMYVLAHFFIYFDCEVIINRNHATVPPWDTAGMWWACCHRPAPTEFSQNERKDLGFGKAWYFATVLHSNACQYSVLLSSDEKALFPPAGGRQ